MWTASSPKKISEVNEAFTSIPVGRTELITWRSLDNEEVEGLLTYPVDYQEGQTYPLALQIHGGPNSVDFNEYPAPDEVLSDRGLCGERILYSQGELQGVIWLR